MENKAAETKAKELVEKFLPNVYCYRGSEMLTNTYNLGVATDFAKDCAIICCDEIMKCTLSKTDYAIINDEEVDEVCREFWQNVKSEIKKL